MSDDQNDRLNRIEKLIVDNNKILHGMRRAARWDRFAQLIYWALIIGSSAAAYYYIQPIFKSILSSYQTILNAAPKGTFLPGVDPKALQDLLKKL